MKRIATRIFILKIEFLYWMFKWVIDEDGDIGLRIAGIVTLIKYKDSTIVKWFKNYEEALRWQGHVPRVSR